MAAFKRLIPLLDRVLVEKIAAPTKSAGGILLPEQAAGKVRRRKSASRVAGAAGATGVGLVAAAARACVRACVRRFDRQCPASFEPDMVPSDGEKIVHKTQ